MSVNPSENETLRSTVLLVIRGIGTPPAFKNSKMLTKGKLITHPRKQKWMKAAEDIIECQLLFKFQTSGTETEMAQALRCSIASSMPADDSCHYLTECSWRFMRVPKKQEGALIIIERLEDGNTRLEDELREIQANHPAKRPTFPRVQATDRPITQEEIDA